jgi:hypothetical protein
VPLDWPVERIVSHVTSALEAPAAGAGPVTTPVSIPVITIGAVS